MKDYENEYENAITKRAKDLSGFDNDTVNAVDYMDFDDIRVKIWNASKNLARYQLEYEKREVFREVEHYGWFYNFNEYDYVCCQFLSKDTKDMYSSLARKLADDLYRELYQRMLDYAHNTESYFYGDNPTIWDQLKYDERHGDPSMNEDELESACYVELSKLKKYELYLMWVYLCVDSHSPVQTYSIDVIVDNKVPENANFKSDIFEKIMTQLCHDAEQENKDDFYRENAADEDYENE